MILSGHEIISRMGEDIEIEPFDASQIRPQVWRQAECQVSCSSVSPQVVGCSVGFLSLPFLGCSVIC